jgi:acyl-CoA synthetase (AMP-forming)/AMP-acid ligase II
MSLRLCGEDGPPAAHTPFQDPGEALFLQFSGGTTGLQKSVVITAPILTSQLGSLRESLRFSSADVVVSWLPLYHDMGLIACLWLPLWHAASSVQLAAQDWLLDAGLLFRSLERHRGTFCWLPNFAFSYLAAQRHRMAGPYSLAHVRAYIDCSEPVRLRSIREFAAAFADWGVNPQQVQASYAMAENVFAATQTQLGRKPSTIPRTALRKAEDPASPAFALADEVFVSSGRPIGGVQVRIVTPQGQACAEREPGEIQLATESLFSGYWGSQGFTTNTFTRDRWYATGDYGFLADGELYVIGRLRDIVIAGGQNIFPEDVEDIVSAVPGVYAGRTVAFGIANAYDTESLIVVAEMKGAYDTDRAAVLEKEIAGILLTAVGIAPERVWVVPERWILKSTAGKISRRETRERYLRERAQKPQSRVAVVGADR